MPEYLEIIPNQEKLSSSFFPTDKEYQSFRESYALEILPELKKHAEQRAESNLDSMRHRIY